MVTDEFGIKLLFPSNKSNFQYYAFPSKKSEAEVSLRENVISRGVFTFFTLPEWGVTDKVFNIEYVETFEQIKTQYLDEEDFRNVENPVNATIQIYSDAFQYDPAHGGTGGVEVDQMCEQDHSQSATQGFSRSAREFRNVEITTYMFVDEIDSKEGYLFFEARSNNNHPGWDAACCSDHGYGVRLYVSENSDFKGKLAFYKRTFSGGQKVLSKQNQNPTKVIDSFYQTAFGIKFIIYNPDFETNERVRMEVWLTPITNWANPELEVNNAWTKVADIEDYVGKHWTSFGKECGAEHDDQPITWAAPFVSFGWRKIRHAKFMYTSFREIDINGSFGEDPIPPPDPQPDPTLPPPPPPVVIPDPPPPVDAEPPATTTTLSKRITLRREIINSSLCVCDGVKTEVGVPPDPDPGGGGGGGGTGTLSQLYFVSLSTKGYAKLAKVSGSTSYYLRFGQVVAMPNSTWLGKRIVRVELTIAEKDNPRGGTGGGVFCRIRKSSDDSIAAELTPVATEENIKDKGIVCVFEKLNNTYQMKFNDKLLFEYDGGNRDNYIKIFRRADQKNDGTKIVWQSNADDAGEYHNDATFDICARIFYVTGQIAGDANTETDYDVTVLRKHRYDVIGDLTG